MVELISQMSAFGGFSSIIFIIVLLLAIKEGYNLFLQAKEVFNVYHKNEQKRTDQETLLNNLNSTVASLTSRIEYLETRLKDDAFRERVPKLENAMVEKDNKIELIINELNNVSDSLKSAEKERRNNTLNTTRSAMYRLWLEAKTNKYVTQASLENFLNLADSYLSMGGNSYYKQFVIPNYLEFPVKEGEDIHSMSETDTILQSVKEKLDG